MSKIAIRVDNLSKLYRIGVQHLPYKTLRESLNSAVTVPFRNLYNLFRYRSLEEPSVNSQVWALKDISFEIKRGEVVGLIGHNGAGKSTLLKILSRITEPTKGYADIYGRVGSLLEVGTGFHPELTGRENIYLNGAILGMKKKEINRKFDEIVDFSAIEKFIDTPVKHYSSGMHMRLAFSVAAHLEPEILVVDEVLAVGDVAFQKKCMGKMNDVANAGRTVIFVSHNLPAIKNLCDRAILMEQGQIKTDGKASDVVKLYLSLDEYSSQKSWRVFERPGNASFRINSITLKTKECQNVSSFNLSEEAYIEIDYEVIQEGSKTGFCVVIFDGEHYCVFSSLSNRELQFYGQPLKIGKYKTVCQLYANLFNSGRYHVSLIGFSGNRSDSFRVENAIAFETIDDGKLKGDYFGNLGGCMMPKLEWQTIYLK